MEKVLALRRQGLSIKEVAAVVGYHPATVSNWLKQGGPPAARLVADEERVIEPRWAGRIAELLRPAPLRERWQSEADQIGMPVGHALEAEVCGRTAPELQPALEWDDVVQALIDPESGLCVRRARFREAHVVEQVAALGGGRLDVAAVERLATAFLDSEEAVLLVRQNRPPLAGVLHRRPPPDRRRRPLPPRAAHRPAGRWPRRVRRRTGHRR